MSENKKYSEAEWIDPDDAPELGNDFFEHANFYVGDKLIKKGRPRLPRPKLSITVRYDADVVEAFRGTGKGWQTRMNMALRQFLNEHPLQNP
jgi:uncharacterized protein (DUF4415 family)